MRTLGNPADVDDLAQEVYLRIFRIETALPIDGVPPFVFKTAKNLLRDRSRRLSRKLQQASVCCDEESLPDASLDPAGRILDGERLQHLASAIDRASDKAQRAFTMSRVAGLRYEEIAERMEVSVSMVEKYISTVLRALKTAEE